MIKNNNNDIFYKIINRLIYSEIVFQDKLITIFKDKYPLAPIHLLIVTNKKIKTINDINYKDRIIIGHCFYIASRISKLYKISETGYRLISNCNKDACQKIFHFHIHLLGGKYLGDIL
ncbi:HIT family protein [endosymbiont of Euscepes postfasciatus]|uniref:HIT domain-containing protein n=1 Tax=endosymbiont of Euscepes postfasciatus TaxID=650377 RepID=UPI000DC6F7C0|nr:HIT domain-containing protein [endosymbiont of Euscepes postfasciatus]BBA84633.1 HIT family protein [endosymbiont of Euscepes postfasciatus]